MRISISTPGSPLMHPSVLAGDGTPEEMHPVLSPVEPARIDEARHTEDPVAFRSEAPPRRGLGAKFPEWPAERIVWGSRSALCAASAMTRSSPRSRPSQKRLRNTSTMKRCPAPCDSAPRKAACESAQSVSLEGREADLQAALAGQARDVLADVGDLVRQLGGVVREGLGSREDGIRSINAQAAELPVDPLSRDPRVGAAELK